LSTAVGTLTEVETIRIDHHMKRNIPQIMPREVILHSFYQKSLGCKCLPSHHPGIPVSTSPGIESQIDRQIIMAAGQVPNPSPSLCVKISTIPSSFNVSPSPSSDPSKINRQETGPKRSANLRYLFGRERRREFSRLK
jgi:hypothetical protein